MTAEVCTQCGGSPGRHRLRRGWCPACYARWRRAGKPASGPPPARPPLLATAVAARKRDRTVQARIVPRVAQVAELTRLGLSAQQIAWEIGIHPRTVVRYRKAARRAGDNGAMPGAYVAPVLPLPPEIDEAEAIAAAMVIACNFVGNGGSPADALLMAEMLGLPRQAFRHARQLVQWGWLDGKVQFAGEPSHLREGQQHAI